MDAAVLFAGIPVSDFATARLWYERFFDRPADVIAHETEVMWRVADGGWLYIVRDVALAGRAIAAIAVTDVEATVAALEVRGMATGPIESQGDAARKAILLDPDGNSIAIIEVAADR